MNICTKFVASYPYPLFFSGESGESGEIAL